MASELIPAPGIYVEKVMPLPAGVSLVRNPETGPSDPETSIAGTTAATVG